MGAYASKLFSNHGDYDGRSKPSQITLGSLEKHQCTPIMTRKSADPRSATIGITRTPIEVAVTPTGATTQRTATAIPKHLQAKQYLETDIDAVMPTMTPEHHRILDPRSPNVTHERTPIVVKSTQQYISPVVHVTAGPDMKTPGLDPRSPATTFDRTPIMKPKSPKSTGHVDLNAQEKLSKCELQSKDVHMSYCETTTDFDVPEVQALPEIVANKPLNLLKRLAKCEKINDSLVCTSNSESESCDSDSEGQITVIPNLKATKSTNTTTTINPEIAEKIEAASKAIRVWRDSISPKPIEQIESATGVITEEIIIEFDDDQSIVKPRKQEIMRIDDIKISTVKPKKVQQLSKETIIIYEDGKNFSGDGNVEVPLNRTPLGNRSNNHKLSLSTKSPQQVSRNKGLSAKSQQQENTPPRIKHYKSKGKGNSTQWDLDRTVVI